MLWKAWLEGRRGTRCTIAALRFLRHEGQFLATRSHPLALSGTSQGLEWQSSTHRPAVGVCDGVSVPSWPWCDCPIAIPWAAGLSCGACSTKAQLPGHGKGGDEKGCPEHLPSCPSCAAQ